jgi:outer membrane scaffolding protein for murein synthesis (MipA/OmpV family)
MKSIAAFLLLLASGAALAEETLLGAGIRTRPAWDGSNSQVTDLIPVVRYYGKPWFARTTQGILEGGARMGLANGLVGGVQLAYEAGRFNKHPVASLGAHLEYDTRLGPAPLTLLGRVRHYLESDHGMQADLRGTLGIHQGGRSLAGVFLQFTFADSENTRAYQKADESGLLYTDLGVLGSYDLSRQWVLVGSAHLRRLNGDYPLTQRRTGLYAAAGLAYRF